MSETPFDPFSIQDEPPPPGPPPALMDQSDGTSLSTNTSKTTNTTNRNRPSARSPRLEGVAEERNAKPLPPRLNVRLALHEEVASTALVDSQGEIGSMSQLSFEGRVTARVESSNANENSVSPFRIQISGPMASLASITCHDHCSLEEEEDVTLNTPFSQENSIAPVRCKVAIPKSVSGDCNVLKYSMNVRTQNMPILVQTKAAIQDGGCRISVQVRSNLSNQGDLSDFTIVVAIPTTLGGTVKVTRGESGAWDANKRIVTWKVGNLPHGESCLVSAEAELSTALAALVRDNPHNTKLAEDKIQCPVLVRCVSEVDQVSDLMLSAESMAGTPATIVQHQAKSYRLLHRVGKTGV